MGSIANVPFVMRVPILLLVKLDTDILLRKYHPKEINGEDQAAAGNKGAT